MREIKFRAFVKKDKAMVSDVRIGSSLNDCLKSDSVIFMQYTGLKDVNGVEIYEGDIVNIDGFAKEVKFEEFKDKSYGHGECYFTRVFGFSFSSRSGREPVVIGNIYQNPELLNG